MVGSAFNLQLPKALELLKIDHATFGYVLNFNPCLWAHEVFIGLVGPDLLDYHPTKVSDNAYQVHVQRCFAYENAVRADVADHREPPICPPRRRARYEGWCQQKGS